MKKFLRNLLAPGALCLLLCLAACAGTPEDAAVQWQTFRISPMGANFQMAFFRNDSGEVIAGMRLNEPPVEIKDLKEYAPGYYKWNELKEYWGE